MVFGRARLKFLKTESESALKAEKGQAKEKGRASKETLETVPKGGMNQKPLARIGHAEMASANTALRAVILTKGKRGENPKTKRNGSRKWFFSPQRRGRKPANNYLLY
jgi:hypothetical protein